MKFTLAQTGFSLVSLYLLVACGPSAAQVDSDGDGVADSIGWAVDEDRDKVADQLDIDYDGIPDGIGVDTDADYEADALGIDTDGDGIADDVVRSAAEFRAWLNGGTGGAQAEVGTGGQTSDPGTGG